MRESGEAPPPARTVPALCETKGIKIQTEGIYIHPLYKWPSSPLSSCKKHMNGSNCIM